eukprot:TRINITY_DN752_c1_g1_i1.p1 TRINITY_DN752_c1_g1~~TRINITY_DN752_c1_g1_i1.p1  ORF type:complete len:312 (-),score=109.73 TRINITY_DN752_c1_g1_i1:960-1895(-)
MPPKRKGKGKGKGKKGKGKKKGASGPKDDGPTKAELLDQIETLKGNLVKEQEERNYFQLERDKINTFWEITKRELEDKKSELRNKDREMEEVEERTQVEIKVYKQKVKHLLYEHQNNVTLLKTDNETALKLQNDDHRTREAELKKDRRALKLELKEQQLSHEDVIKNLKQDQDKNITKLRQEYERQTSELQAKYEDKVRTLREELDVRRKIEIMEIEERKNQHINELMKKHERAFGEIKNYYNDITHNNLDLIKTLKQEVSVMKKNEVCCLSLSLSRSLSRSSRVCRHTLLYYHSPPYVLSVTLYRLPMRN